MSDIVYRSSSVLGIYGRLRYIPASALLLYFRVVVLLSLLSFLFIIIINIIIIIYC